MKLVIALATLLVAALIALVLWMRAGGKEPSAPDARAPRQPSAQPSSQSTPSSRPAAETDGDEPPAGKSTGRRDGPVYKAGDVTIHDRRPAGSPPLDPTREFTPVEGKRITREYARTVVDRMEPAAKQCLASSLPTEARPANGEKTKLLTEMTVEVKNGSLTVSNVGAKVAGLEDSVIAPTVECLRQQMVGTKLDAAGQPDVASYSITTYYSP